MNTTYSPRSVTSPRNTSSTWHARYSKLYLFRGVSLMKQPEEPRRVSFMSDDTFPKSHAVGILSMHKPEPQPPSYQDVIDTYRDTQCSTICIKKQDLEEYGTTLLDMVRKRNQEKSNDETLKQPLELPKDDNTDAESDGAFHNGDSLRQYPERSVSRSRVSRISTRRDMDIPSILAFSSTVTAPQATVGLPAFPKLSTPPAAELPRYSIRRSVCPVCSQKWSDKSSIKIVKYSGLKRNSSLALPPSVIAPARLRISINLSYTPRPVQAALDEEQGIAHGTWRSTTGSWQLTRARKFRLPKPLLAEAGAIPGAAAKEISKDIDTRVNKFLMKPSE